jgi:hypothetical protein
MQFPLCFGKDNIDEFGFAGFNSSSSLNLAEPTNLSLTPVFP